MIKQAEEVRIYIITCPEILVNHFNDHSRELVIRASALLHVNIHDLKNSFHLHLLEDDHERIDGRP